MTHDELIENELDDLIEEKREIKELEAKIAFHDHKDEACNCGDWRERLKELGK